MVSYPLSLPSGVAEATITPTSAVAISSSPFTGSQQVQAWPGEWWVGEIRPPKRRDGRKARAMSAFITALRGPLGTFLMGDPTAPLPCVNTKAASVTIASAAETGARSIDTVGWQTSDKGLTADSTWPTADSTEVIIGYGAYALRAGDYIQVGSGSASRLHKLLSDAEIEVAGSVGSATLEIWPPLRAGVAVGDAVVYRNPVGLWRLDGSKAGSWSGSDRVLVTPGTLSIIEAMDL